MPIHFEKWNPGTGRLWATIVSEIDGTSANLTVEEAREFALDIIYRAWPAERVQSLINEIRSEDAKI